MHFYITTIRWVEFKTKFLTWNSLVLNFFQNSALIIYLLEYNCRRIIRLELTVDKPKTFQHLFVIADIDSISSIEKF